MGRHINFQLLNERQVKMAQTGLFELSTPRDLLAKLRHDMTRLETDPLDQYAVFDFFITAHHMTDWMKKSPRSKERRQYERRGVVLRKVCSHIANGSKHFEADASRHDSVSSTRLHEGPFSQAFSDAFDISRLEVHLEGDAAKELGSVVTVLRLARRVLAFWEAHPCFKPRLI
jgi:hypothetical protein